MTELNLGDTVTPNCEFGSDTTGVPILRPGMRLTVCRVFQTSRGPRVAVADETGRQVCDQTPVGWLEVVE